MTQTTIHISIHPQDRKLQGKLHILEDSYVPRHNVGNTLAILADKGYTKISSFFLANELFIHCKKENK